MARSRLYARAHDGCYYTAGQELLKPEGHISKQPGIPTEPVPDPIPPTIIPRPEHRISRADISENALKVLYRLRKAGFDAFLVGGSVRDLLLGHRPKDFDIATNALPEEVKEVFSNCRLIGRRFRLAHVHFGREIIEVATFRAGHDGDGEGDGLQDDAGRLIRDNVYGTIGEDALRRDFTVNGLYYNIADFSIYDYAGGIDDLRRGVLRLIGDPAVRFREDPVRMLRAVRFAAKLDFAIDQASEEAIHELGPLLRDIAPARLFEECMKLFLSGHALASFEGLRRHDLLGHLFPATQRALAAEDQQGTTARLLQQAMENTDRRIADERPVTPAFLFAALLWEPVRYAAAQAASDRGPAEALHLAASDVVEDAIAHVTIPRRFRVPMREIWHLQPRFERRGGKRVWQLLAHPRFRAAYDFLLLRAGAREVDPELADWWTRLQSVDRAEQERMVSQHGSRPGSRRRRRRGRRTR